MKLTKQTLYNLILQEMARGGENQQGFQKVVKGEHWFITTTNTNLRQSSPYSMELRYAYPGSDKYWHINTIPGNSIEDCVYKAKQYIDEAGYMKHTDVGYLSQDAIEEFHNLIDQLIQTEYVKNLNTSKKFSKWYGFDQ
jgi:hypothetical protein